ncbi:MAG TPA: GNAT family N-acetyltransferase [Bdellovibrionota bacterium]|jgi:GNAT superfamily N-acetyltransferase
MSAFQIHPFEGEYEALAALFRDVYSDWPGSAEKIKTAEESFPRNIFRRFWVARKNGEVAGAAILTQDKIFFHPRYFSVSVWIHKAHRRLGAGGLLFDHLLSQLGTLNPEIVMATTPEDFTDSIRFLEKRGFHEDHRSFQSKLTLSDFDFQKFAALEPKVEAQGIKIEKCMEVSDPGDRREFYDVLCKIDRDIPGAELRPTQTFEDCWKRMEKYLAAGESLLVAKKNGRMIGLHFGGPMPGTDFFHVKFTGVLPEFKKLGVASLLKAKGLEDAKAKGFKTASTWNHSKNEPILALNTKFGFKREPATIGFIRRF